MNIFVASTGDLVFDPNSRVSKRRELTVVRRSFLHELFF